MKKASICVAKITFYQRELKRLDRKSPSNRSTSRRLSTSIAWGQVPSRGLGIRPCSYVFFTFSLYTPQGDLPKIRVLNLMLMGLLIRFPSIDSVLIQLVSNRERSL